MVVGVYGFYQLRDKNIVTPNQNLLFFSDVVYSVLTIRGLVKRIHKMGNCIQMKNMYIVYVPTTKILQNLPLDVSTDLCFYTWYKPMTTDLRKHVFTISSFFHHNKEEYKTHSYIITEVNAYKNVILRTMLGYDKEYKRLWYWKQISLKL